MELQLSYTNEACPECGGITTTDYERGERICQVCGLVVEDRLVDLGPEWQVYSYDDWKKRARIGSPVSNIFHDKGCGTRISRSNRDKYGKLLSGHNLEMLHRIRRADLKVNQSDRKLIGYLDELRKISSMLNLPREIVEDACLIFKKAREKGLKNIKKPEAMVVASIYSACRRANIPIRLIDLANTSNVGRKYINRAYKALIKNFPNLYSKPETPEIYIQKICSALRLGQKVRERAIGIIRDPRNSRIVSGRTPAGLAASAVYLALKTMDEEELKEIGGPRTQEEIGGVVNVTPVTLRNIYKKLYPISSVES